MYFAKMKGCVLVGLLGALRLFGGFPYVFRSTEGGKMKIKKSIAAILWTCLIVSALVAKVYIYTYIDLARGLVAVFARKRAHQGECDRKLDNPHCQLLIIRVFCCTLPLSGAAEPQVSCHSEKPRQE